MPPTNLTIQILSSITLWAEFAQNLDTGACSKRAHCKNVGHAEDTLTLRATISTRRLVSCLTIARLSSVLGLTICILLTCKQIPASVSTCKQALDSI